uniref:Uncharacterized protein n=1 Tax=Fagus sylvatica TaxID=28930 RepID=A0A2N9J8R1_FAGSY
MATMLRSSLALGNMGYTLLFRRFSHVMSLPPPFDAPIHSGLSSPLFVLPESNQNPDNNNIGFGFEFPSFSFGGGSMELMAVPKRKLKPKGVFFGLRDYFVYSEL